MWTFSDAILWFQRKETPWKGKVVGSGEVCWGCTNPVQLFTPKGRGCCWRVWQKVPSQNRAAVSFCNLARFPDWLHVPRPWTPGTHLQSLSCHSAFPTVTCLEKCKVIYIFWFKTIIHLLNNYTVLAGQMADILFLTFFFKLQWVFIAIHGLFIAACRV